MTPKILFIGGTPRGFELLKELLKNGETVVYSYIMKEDEHETIKVSNDIKQLCKIDNIPSIICKKITNEQLSQSIELKPDVAFVCGWRTLIPPALFNDIPFGCLAAHDSLLPKYRGFAPLNWAIINGEKKTGVTLFKISNGPVDSGNVFAQKVVAVGEEETATEVYPRIIEGTLQLYKEFLTTFRAGNLKYQKQKESQATYTCKRIPGDGEINWHEPCRKIFNLIRALSPPYPCAWTSYNNEKVFVKKASLPNKQLTYSGNIPGRVVSVLENGVLILCGKGQIIVNDVFKFPDRRIKANKLFSSLKITLGS